jgi:hypothetical protein
VQNPQWTQARRISFDRAVSGSRSCSGVKVVCICGYPIRPGFRMPRGSNLRAKPLRNARPAGRLAVEDARALALGLGLIGARTQRRVARNGQCRARAGRCPRAPAPRPARRPSRTADCARRSGPAPRPAEGPSEGLTENRQTSPVAARRKAGRRAPRARAAVGLAVEVPSTVTGPNRRKQLGQPPCTIVDRARRSPRSGSAWRSRRPRPVRRPGHLERRGQRRRHRLHRRATESPVTASVARAAVSGSTLNATSVNIPSVPWLPRQQLSRGRSR